MPSSVMFHAPGAARRNARPRTRVLLAFAVLVALAGCSRPADHAPAPAPAAQGVTLTPAQRAHVRLYTVAMRDVHATTEAPARVDFDNTQATAMLAPFSGPVTRLLVAPGDTVRQGQPLAVVDSSDFAEAIGAYRKAVVAARNARRVADMADDLVKHDGVSPREAAQADSDAASAEADRDAALQALTALHVDPATISQIRQGRAMPNAQALIRAPIAGTVVERQITPGQLLQAGSTPCFVVADLSRMWVVAQIPSADLAQVQVGDPADITTPNGEPLTGSVTNIAAEVDADTGLVPVRITVANPERRLRRQMYVNVQLHARAARHALPVPAGAVLRDEANLPFVYMVRPDHSYARRHVTLGPREGGDYVVRQGLKAGDQVVVDGGLFLQFMQSQ